MELYNNFDNASYDAGGNWHTKKKSGFFNNIIDILTLKPENNRLDIGGLSFDMDNLIIIGIIFFLLTDNSCDILLVICLGLSLLNVDLNPFT